MSAADAQPLSWLVLEQYVLGELPDARRLEVEAQLAQSPADREALRCIQEDQSQLPPLPELAGLGPVLRPGPRPIRSVPDAAAPNRWGWVAAPLLAAAAAWLLLRVDPAALPPARRALKGGELALRVVSERGGDADAYGPGEALKLLVTCPPDLGGTLAAVVYQGEDRFSPLPDAPGLACGNQVPWPGAFQIDGVQPAHVCVASATDAARAQAPADLGPISVCVTLRAR